MNTNAEYVDVASADPSRVADIVSAVNRLIAGYPPVIQSAVIADLLATWIAGHIVRDNPKLTDELRDALLENHLGLVAKLIPINARMIHGN